MKYTILFILTGIILISMKSDKPAYRIFDVKGNNAGYKEFLKEASKADVVFFGEHHNVSICHWLQLEVVSDLYKEKEGKILLGAEMFEADNQLIINEYLGKKIKDKNFEAEARLWPNYKTDYKPLMVFARDSSLPFIATNVPRRYASMVNGGGFEILDQLDTKAYDYIARLPIAYDPELKCYKDMIEEMGGSEHVSPNITKAQALKDATMAEFIFKNLKEGSTFIHFNGTYHSDNFQGIVWYLKKLSPNLRIVTLSTVEQGAIDKLNEEHMGKGDFILAIPETMAKTY